jgi:hypothetical protein
MLTKEQIEQIKHTPPETRVKRCWTERNKNATGYGCEFRDVDLVVQVKQEELPALCDQAALAIDLTAKVKSLIGMISYYAHNTETGLRDLLEMALREDVEDVD